MQYCRPIACYIITYYSESLQRRYSVPSAEACARFWDRALGLPIERPKSITPEWIEQTFHKDLSSTDTHD